MMEGCRAAKSRTALRSAPLVSAGGAASSAAQCHDRASLGLRSGKRTLNRRRRPARLVGGDDGLLVLKVDVAAALREELDADLRRLQRRPHPGLAHGRERDGAHDREAHAGEHGVVSGAAALAAGFQRHRVHRLGLLRLEGAQRVRVRHASVAGDRDERRRRRDHGGLLLLAIVRHRHLLHGGVLGHHLLTLLAHELLQAQLLHGLALLALQLLLAREERLHALALCELLLVALLLGVPLRLLLLHLLEGALAAAGRRLSHALLVLSRLALRELCLLARSLLGRAQLLELRLLLRDLRQALLLRDLRQALLLRDLRRALLLLLGNRASLGIALLRELGHELLLLALHLALLLELAEELLLLGLDLLRVRRRSRLHGSLHLRRELHALHHRLRVLVLCRQ